jgi:hypothetical protein
MIGSTGDETPYDFAALVVLCIFAVALLVGCIVGPAWSSDAANYVRRGLLLAAIAVMLAVYLVTPTANAFFGAGRFVTLWPAMAANVLFFAIWTWRVGRW